MTYQDTPEYTKVREQIIEAGELLILAYQARVDDEISSGELLLYVDTFPDSIFALDSILLKADDQSVPVLDPNFHYSTGCPHCGNGVDTRVGVEYGMEITVKAGFVRAVKK